MSSISGKFRSSKSYDGTDNLRTSKYSGSGVLQAKTLKTDEK